MLLVGDSITAGRVSEPKGPAYADLLAERLGRDYAIERAACSGSDSADWIRSAEPMLCAGEWVAPSLYEALVSPHLPSEVAVVLLGTNDSSGRGASTHPDEYEGALRELVDRLRADGAGQVILVAPPPVYDRSVRYRRLHEFGSRVRALCEEDTDVVCGPDLFRLLTPEDFEAQDVHPNRSGHAKIAEALAEALGAAARRGG